MATPPNAESIEAARQKYRQERDKRLEAGTAQYFSPTDDLTRYEADPRTGEAERAPIDEACDVLVVGAGHGGLLAGAEMRKLGFTGLIRFIDQAGAFGGNWYWNRYPGAECDTQSYIYMPLLEETGYVPSKRYADATEILEHAQRIARHYGFHEGAVFHTAVTSMEWDEELARWHVRTDRDDEFRARYVVIARGIGLTRPRLPGIPGIADFQGHSFHTGRWDFEYTGGDNRGTLHKLRGKRVAMIGTGPSAIQCIPHLGESAEHLYVFQRTPSSIDVRGNRPTDDEFRGSIEPGWQWRRIENFSLLTAGSTPGTDPTAIFSIIPEDPTFEDMTKDGWTEIPSHVLGMKDRSSLSPEEMAEIAERIDFEKMERIRNRVDEIVKDKADADALKAYYRFWCKRPCFHDEYLATYNRSNVTLVDTHGKGMERITERGVVANGEEYEVDLIVYASGYDPAGLAFEVIGRGGMSLSQKWADGICTLYGMQTQGFPNCFMMQVPQASVSANVTHILWGEARHIARIMKRVTEHDFQTVDAKKSAEDEWVETVARSSLVDIDFLENCTPGNFNSEGQFNGEAMKINGPYGPGMVAFSQVLDRWYEEGTYEGLEFEDRPGEPASAS